MSTTSKALTAIINLKKQVILYNEKLVRIKKIVEASNDCPLKKLLLQELTDVKEITKNNS